MLCGGLMVAVARGCPNVIDNQPSLASNEDESRRLAIRAAAELIQTFPSFTHRLRCSG